MTRSGSRRGFTLIEVIVALALLLIGIVGMMNLHVFGSTSDAAARDRTLASKVGEELLRGLERLPLTDPQLAPNTSGDAVPAEFGPLLDGNTVMGGTYFTWSDASPVPGVRTDAELAAGPEALLADPQTGEGLQRRWTVWDYVPAGGKATVTRLISVSIIYHEPGRPKPRELVFYGQRDNPGPLLLEMVL